MVEAADLFGNLSEGQKGVFLSSKTDSDRSFRKEFTEKDTSVIVPEGQSEQDNKLWLTSTLGIGYSCRKARKKESPNQDSFFVLAIEDEYILFGVLDGHGRNGHDVSNMAIPLLLKHFFALDFRSDLQHAFTQCFTKTQLDMEKQQRIDCVESGTTCTMAFYDFMTDQLTVAHVGDSRAVIGKWKSTSKKVSCDAVTVDHKPQLPAEKSRIEKSGGRVVFDGAYNYRVMSQEGAAPGINMSRVLGDIFGHKQAGLIARPDVKTVDLQPMRETFGRLVLLICSDGVWEFIKKTEAMKIMDEALATGAPDSEPEEIAAAHYLAKVSWDRWMKDTENTLSDDITTVWCTL